MTRFLPRFERFHFMSAVPKMHPVKVRIPMKRIITVLLALITVTAKAAEAPLMIRGARALGMGDALTALADDQNVFFYNPAGAIQRTGSLITLMDLQATVSADVLETMDFISANKEDLQTFDTLPPTRQAELINKINAELIQLKPSFGVSFPNVSYLSTPSENRWHWGFGVFSQASGRLGFNPTVLVPSLYYDINADVAPMVNIAKAWPKAPFLPGKWGVGANVKYLNRGQVQDANVSVLALDNFETPPLQRAKGWGVDLGLLYQPTDRWNLGMTVMDAGSTKLEFDALDAENGFSAKPAHSAIIRQRINLGVAWTPARLGIGSIGLPTGSRLTLAADLRDIVNKDSKTFFDGGFLADTAGKHIHLGAEYRWWFLRLRGGANQGYSTFGAGIDWPALKIDYAYFSDEAGAFAGTSQHSAHTLSVALRFGTGRTQARDRVGRHDEESAPESK